MKSTLNIHGKGWYWSWNSNTLTTWCEESTHCKGPLCWERLKAKGEGETEDTMVGWHHQLNGHEFEQTLADGDGQGSLACCGPWVAESDMIERLNNNIKSDKSKRKQTLQYTVRKDINSRQFDYISQTKTTMRDMSCLQKCESESRSVASNSFWPHGL